MSAFGKHYLCFNSRSREGSDRGDIADTKRIYRFNSRSREGSDLRQTRLDVRSLVSTRAPVKGATCFGCILTTGFNCFNSRSREGSDDTVDFRRHTCHRFNSRSREGSDSEAVKLAYSLNVSTRAPVKGATNFS